MGEQDNVQTATQATVTPDAAGGGQQPGKVFTQADVDAIISERLKRQAAQFKDYDQLKEQATHWQSYQEQQKTEQQKLAEVAETAKRERDEALQRAQSRLIRAAFVAEAAKAGASHPEDVYALADISKVTLDDQDNVVGAAEAVQAVIAAGRVPTTQAQRAPNLDAGAGNGQRAADVKKTALGDEEREAARKLGLTPEAYARGKQASR